MREASRRANEAYTELIAAVSSSKPIAGDILKLDGSPEAEDVMSSPLLNSWKQDLEREGGFLSPENKKRVRYLTAAIRAKANEYTEHIWDDHDKLSLTLSGLEGVPETFVSARQVHGSAGKIRVSRKKADINPILTFCDIQATREKVYRHHYNTASPSNRDVLGSLLSLRREKAVLLGCTNWATYEMKRTMIQSPQQATAFLCDLRRILIGPASTELARMKELAAIRGVENFHIWDVAYGQELMRREAHPAVESRQAPQCLSVSSALPPLMAAIESMFSVRFLQLGGIVC